MRGTTHLSANTLRLGILTFAVVTFLLWASHRTISNRLVTQDLPSERIPEPEEYTTEQNFDLSNKFHGSNDVFWNSLLGALEENRPKCDWIFGIHLNESDQRYRPLEPLRPFPHNINITDEIEEELMRKHYSMRRDVLRLAPNLPYVKDTTGIVVTGSPDHLAYFLVSLRMLRRTGTQLPVEFFLAGQHEYDAPMCEEILPALNARCVVMSQIFAPKLDHFQYKVFAILLSSFQNVLMLDSDAFPIHDPSTLFTTRPYTSHGLVIWPDLWANSVSPHFYHVARIPEVPVSTRRSSETGQVLMDKGKHQESLLMMVYYNYYGPSHYYSLLSQGSAGQGDKDTFIQAAMAMDLPFYAVRTPEYGLGRWHGIEEGFHMVAMAQRDPAEDWMYGEPMPSHIRNKDTWDDEDAAYEKSAKELALPRPTKPRPLFVHQMVRKIRPSMIDREDMVATKDENGGWRRMWTTKEEALKIFGYDAEKVLWKVVEQVACVDKIEEEHCDKIKEYRAAVF